MKKAIYQTQSTEETITLAEKLAKKLLPGDTVLLYGDLGMGKTQFSKGLIKGLGIEERVKSPTYTYVNKFEMSGVRGQVLGVYHYDLYRLNEGDDLSSIGFEETTQDPKAINVVEWADRIEKRVADQMEGRIEVRIVGQGDQREISIEFYRSSILPASEIENYYEEWATPMHVRDHCKQVTNVAMQIAAAYVKKGVIVNYELLFTAAMLHDMNRVCDFRTLEREKFPEEVTDEKWQRWLSLREQYKGKTHGDIAYEILMEQGFTETAKVIQLHLSKNLILKTDQYDSLEKKILYYADKRVKHDEIVDLTERFRDGRERYGNDDTDEEVKLYQDIEKKTFELEKELFEKLDINPEDIT